MSTLDFLFVTAGNISCLLVGFLVGRTALKNSIEKRVKKEIYEQAKLDGAFEFIRESLFKGITKS